MGQARGVRRCAGEEDPAGINAILLLFFWLDTEHQEKPEGGVSGGGDRLKALNVGADFDYIIPSVFSVIGSCEVS